MKEYLVSAAPIVLLLEHAFPQHAHHLAEMLIGVRELGYFLHESAMWTPGLFVRGLAHLYLDFCVVHDNICAIKFGKIKNKTIKKRFNQSVLTLSL